MSETKSEGKSQSRQFTLRALSRKNIADIQKLAPLMQFIEPNIVECPTTWREEANGIVDDQDVQMIRGDGSVRLAAELELAKLKHSKDEDFDRLLFLDVETHLFVLENKWLEFVDYSTLRVPVGWKIDNVRGRTIVRNKDGKFMANHFRGAECFDILCKL